MPRYSVFDIANYFLYKAEEQDQELLSNLKLQKLVYYAQGLHLVEFGKALFKEKIIAWQYGPVVQKLYHKYSEYGAASIPGPDNDFSPEMIDEDAREYLDAIFEFFGQYSAPRLVELSHSDECWQSTKIRSEISHESMTRCLKKYLADA